MLAIPIVMLVAIWLFAVSVTLESALDLRNSKLTGDKVTEPAEAMVEQLQVERQLTTVYLAGGRADAAAVREQRAKSDVEIAEFRALATDRDLQDVASAETKRAIVTVTEALDGLAQLRSLADGGGAAGTVRQGYSAIIMATYAIGESATNHRDSDVAEEALGVFVLGLSRDLFSQEDALVAEAATSGQFTGAVHTELVTVIGQKRLVLPYGVSLLPEEAQQRYQALVSGAAMRRLAALEDRLLATAPGSAQAAGIDLGQWRAAFDPVNEELKAFRSQMQRQNVQAARDASDAIFLRLGVAGLAGLVAVVLSLVLSVRIGRSLARRLDGLRVAALELADERLPSVVSRLRRGVAVDVAAEVPPLRLGTDEIGQVGEAFNSVQRTAVASAVEEASVRQGMNEVFLNIARRSQTLLHRQLSLLDGMERRTSEPEDLADLFRVDHLATRMRRHAEDLVILAGATPGRGWRNPVPVVDVVRGAVSEIEDYARVQVLHVGDGAVVGRAVGDVIHLLAELVENATVFSPPHTRVRVSGQSVPNGFVIEIEDRGLGMVAEAIAEANRRLAEPPEFDPASSARLGLFVVAQLAARHGVRVVLRPSPYGGVTAVVLLPVDLVVAPAAMEGVAAESFSWLPAGPAAVPSVRRPLPVAPDPDVVAVEPDSPGPDGGPDGGGDGGRGRQGLPRRVRQRGLAPQLQDDSTVVIGAEELEAPARSPEELRRMMASFQAGTVRGRHASAGDAGDTGRGV
ncbi:hypothetical protein GCM10010399_69120 [Dactylosporangium fulvum]|uniref:histidine kinase n=1 Tax=Dactylosporangium fulvum TaxID=53359 RepID=A0ABY5VM75_9ACTN|nr:nitrate- and nitrite sensing domain-containing protein [Dactylosporangium fulvum]UWP78430.1 nitrate- and nitrite sensing domain-containing protein [Dactylosporangium fulvum]